METQSGKSSMWEKLQDKKLISPTNKLVNVQKRVKEGEPTNRKGFRDISGSNFVQIFFKQSVCLAVINCCSEYSCSFLLVNSCKNFSRVYTKICNWFIEYSSSLPSLDVANFSFQFTLQPAAEISLEQTSSPAPNVIKFLFVYLASLVGVKYYFSVVLKIFWCLKSSWFGSSVKT